MWPLTGVNGDIGDRGSGTICGTGVRTLVPSTRQNTGELGYTGPGVVSIEGVGGLEASVPLPEVT